MRHNQFNHNFSFYKSPVNFNKFSDKSLLQYCLGATLYMPGTKNILDKILNKNFDNLTSMVMDFEDALESSAVEKAEQNVLNHLTQIHQAIEKGKLDIDDLPLIFLRVRNTSQFASFSLKLERHHAIILTGFVFPKFYSNNASEYINQLKDLNHKFNIKLYGMPILEGRTIAYKETRLSELKNLLKIIEPNKDLILNIRIGGTDFSSIFGVRRGMTSSIYDILTVRDCLSDILNFFNRDTSDYTVSGPVWEYFLAYKKDDLKELIEKDINNSLQSRSLIINEAIDGLLRELLIDKVNGFIGKTVIHPSHIKFVNALQTVTVEEYQDAKQILDTDGGVIKSLKSNKMNEINPHRNWANNILNRAKAYGVVEDESSFIKLLV